MILLARGKEINFDTVRIMGILNVTPDSFSDGGKFIEKDIAVEQALKMAREGADVIDVGGESTRPGAAKITQGTEASRVVPVIKAMRDSGMDLCVSVDTYRASTAFDSLMAGADIVNDISGGTFEPGIMRVAADAGAGFIIMHINGMPDKMQENPVYSRNGVISDIMDFFRERILAALEAGLKKENLMLDPGIGFGKTLRDNFEIIDRLGEFREFGIPVLVGTSRKSMIGKVLGLDAGNRLFGTAASVALCAAKGADMLRVHDVKEMKETAVMTRAMTNYK